MVVGVQHQMVFEGRSFFGGAPGSAKHPVHIGSDHGCRMVEAKQGIKADFFQLALTGYTSSPAFIGLVRSLRVH
jgi:hypothetical protein